MKAAVYTRRVYAMEKELEREQVSLPMYALRDIGQFYARDEVKIVAGRGVKYNGRLLSYYDGEKIVLARNGRKASVVLHEVAHSLAGFVAGHGPKFMRIYVDLLTRYGVIDSDALEALLYKYNIRVPDKRKRLDKGTEVT